jgi:5-methylcytosine-specific restriction enzyme A
MIRSCKHCGTYHDVKFNCGKKPVRQKKSTPAEQFRRKWAWKKKSIQIRERDKGMCQVCIRNLYHTQQQYTFENIDVHHIIKLEVDITRGLDDDNLISVCRYHHTLADAYTIPIKELHEIAAEQERKNTF